MMPRSDVSPKHLFWECIILYTITMVFTRLNHVVTAPVAGEAVYVCVLVSLMVLPFLAMKLVNRRSGEASGAEIVLSVRDAGLGLLTAVILVPIVLASVWLWFSLTNERVFSPSLANFTLQDGSLPELILTQLILVAMPEEFFYRGYLLTTLRDGFSRRFAWSDRKVNVIAVIVTSAMFAAAHTLGGDPVRLNTFFPALLFGFLRIRSDGILGCIFLHASCNLMLQFILMQFTVV